MVSKIGYGDGAAIRDDNYKTITGELQSGASALCRLGTPTGLGTIRALEPRILLDAAALATGVEAVDNQAVIDAQIWQQAQQAVLPPPSAVIPDLEIPFAPIQDLDPNLLAAISGPLLPPAPIAPDIDLSAIPPDHALPALPDEFPGNIGEDQVQPVLPQDLDLLPFPDEMLPRDISDDIEPAAILEALVPPGISNDLILPAIPDDMPPPGAPGDMEFTDIPDGPIPPETPEDLGVTDIVQDPDLPAIPPAPDADWDSELPVPPIVNIAPIAPNDPVADPAIDVPVIKPVQIAFVDASVDDLQTILDSLDPNIEVIFIDEGSDGIKQIADALKGRSDIGAIHIISHGRSGTLDLGTAKLTEISIANKYADEMAVIRDAMAEDGDILIYACDFAQGARGVSAVDALALATGADVAASDDLTGAAVLGGDWDLEVQSGEIEADAIEALAFASVLATPVASPDAPTVITGTAVVIDPLANDTDAGGHPLNVSEIIDTAGGGAVTALTTAGDTATLVSGTTITLRADGRLDVVAGSDGVEVFDYRVSDGTASDTETITLTAASDEATADAIGFVTTWNTSNAGATASNQIRINSQSGGDDYIIYWGDGTSETVTGSSVTHTYAAAGSYQVTIVGEFSGFFFNNGNDGDKLTSIDQWGNVAFSDMGDAFEGTDNLVIAALDNPDLTNVSDMRDMSHKC